MRFHIRTLVRPADVDVSDLTTAKRTGLPEWVKDGVLEIPFDRRLSGVEVAAVKLRLTTADAAEEALHRQLAAYLTVKDPSATQTAAQVKALTRLVLAEGVTP